MASYMENWWRKHDMDKDGKGCCLIFMLFVLAVFIAGGSFACFLIWSVFL